MNFVCPKCANPLTEEGGSARCKNGHSFDKAKAGYYNLILSSVGGTHGDNRDMVEARRDFLDTGAYKPLADKVSELVIKHTGGGLVQILRKAVASEIRADFAAIDYLCVDQCGSVSVK